MTYDDEDKKFVLVTGFEIKKVFLNALRKEYSSDPTKMKNMFMSSIINIIVNIVDDVSTNEDGLRQNLNTIAESLKTFLDRELTPAEIH